MKTLFVLSTLLITLLLELPSPSLAAQVHILDGGIIAKTTVLPQTQGTIAQSTDTIPLTDNITFGILFTLEDTLPKTATMVEIRLERPTEKGTRETKIWFLPVTPGTPILAPYNVGTAPWPHFASPGQWQFTILTDGVMRASKTFTLVTPTEEKASPPQPEEQIASAAPTPPTPSTPPVTKTESYFVQVGAFLKQKNALEMITELSKKKIRACFISTNTPKDYFFVTLGTLQSEEDATAQMQNYMQTHHAEALVKKLEPGQKLVCPPKK